LEGPATSIFTIHLETGTAGCSRKVGNFLQEITVILLRTAILMPVEDSRLLAILVLWFSDVSDTLFPLYRRKATATLYHRPRI
jgi:hypothetical protein